ncbi:MAG: VWA domain-containing protein [Planctomycetaceae bacterium]|nr:VWA domain-containing protein [Planctomycetaceae bacterium]
MSWLGFQALQYSWLFLLLIPLILFYFLKLKRPQQRIASLVLWQQVLDDQRVNSPFQRFKRNILLLLQLLLLTLLILAALQPFFTGGAERARYIPIVIDTSASMGAIDAETGESRLDVARKRIIEMIDSLTIDQQMSLVAVDSSARRLTDFTNDKRMLRNAINDLEVVDLPGKLEDGLRMVQAMSRTVPVEEVILFSDGNFPEQINFELPYSVNYQQLPQITTNLGITSFNAQRVDDDSWDLFAVIEASRETIGADLKLLENGKEIDSSPILVGEETPHRFGVRVNVSNETQFELQLVPKQHDCLAADNRAFLMIPRTRALRIFVDPEMVAYRHVLSSLERIEVYPTPGTNPETAAGDFDLIISREPPTTLRSAPLEFYENQIPSDLETLVTVQEDQAMVIDWFRTSPLLEHVLLQNLLINQEPAYAEDVGEKELRDLGYEILVHGQKGPLMLQQKSIERNRYFMLFDSGQSTFPFRIGFPIMVTNVVQEAMEVAGLSQASAVKTGVLPEQLVSRETEYGIEGPRGLNRTLSSDSHGLLAGIPAPYVGEYEIRDGSDVIARRGASLIDPRESSLAANDKIQFDELPVSAASAQVDTDRPLWRYLVFGAFGFLMLEWWFFQRRPTGLRST